jgi:hypothetical protein
MHQTKQWVKPLVATVLAALAIRAEATATTGTFSIDGFVSNPPCLTESLQLSGALFFMNNYAVEGNVVNTTSLLSARGITGIGSVSGTIYSGVGVWQASHVKTTLTGVEVVVTTTQNFGFTSHGQSVDVMLHADVHSTISPDGTVTTTFEKVRVDCRNS